MDSRQLLKLVLSEYETAGIGTMEWIFSSRVPEVRPSQMTGRFALLLSAYSEVTDLLNGKSPEFLLSHDCMILSCPCRHTSALVQRHRNGLKPTEKWQMNERKFKHNYRKMERTSASTPSTFLFLPFFPHLSFITVFHPSFSIKKYSNLIF